MDKNEFECGAGWYHLIEPLLSRLHEMGGTATQIKEKFGELRFHYHEGEDDVAPFSVWERFAEDVLEAEQKSRKTCELCGAPGVTMVKGGWFKTVCVEHAKQLGYKGRA
jgi:hypothetical protein